MMQPKWRRRVLATPPPGSGLKPLVGNMGMPLFAAGLAYFRWGPAQMMTEYRRNGPITWSKPLGVPLVEVSGPEAVQVVMTNKDKAFGQGWDYYIGKFFTRGLLLLSFEEHMFHRRLMQHAFTRPRLEGYFSELTQLTDKGVESWPTDRSIDLYPTLKELTLEVASEIFMATDVGAERERLNEAFIACVRASAAIVRRPVPGGHWKPGLEGRKVLEEYFYRMVPEKRASDHGDIFSALCHARGEDGEQFTDADIVNHMIFLIMAAHDTSTVVTSSVAYYLGKHPEWQERARAESRARGDAKLDMATLEGLTTLDLVIKEATRLISPVPGFVRRTVKDTEILGHYVPAGTLIGVNHWVNHMMPELWTDPETFDPDRFSDERREDKSHRFAWLPFGSGAHKCIGMHFGTLEVKAIIDAMLRNYEWSFEDGYEMPIAYTAIPYPSDKLPIVFRRRR